jgi:hypothetical protein
MWQEDIDNIPQSDSELESDNDDNSSSIEDNDDGDDDAQRKSSQPKIQDEHMETQETAALNEETKEPATPNEQKTLEDATNEQPAASSTTKEINASQTVKRNLTTKRKRHEKEQITPRTSARTANKPGDTEITKPRHQVEHNPQARKYTKRTNCTSRYENRETNRSSSSTPFDTTNIPRWYLVQAKLQDDDSTTYARNELECARYGSTSGNNPSSKNTSNNATADTGLTSTPSTIRIGRLGQIDTNSTRKKLR